ncbi:MAG: sporulation protein YqfD [Sarcina sp.]
MRIKGFSTSLMRVEVKIFKKENLLNILNNKSIKVKNIESKNAITLEFDIYYMDYEELCIIVKNLDGKIKIISNGKKLETAQKIKRNIGIFIGSFLFIIIIFGLSKFVWRIDIDSKDYLAPYEIRTYLNRLDIKPGVLKGKIDVYDIEKQIERNIEEIMWINIRIEGSTLKVRYEEKSLTSMNNENQDLVGSDKIATMDGRIKRIYTTSGTARVKEGDVVKKGDILIVGEQIIKDQIIDGENVKNKVLPEGRVIAETFYEKIVDIKLSGNEEVRTGNIEEEIFINFFRKKINLKKASKDFTTYDKIEKKGKFINKNIYYEKELKEITKVEEDIIGDAVKNLKNATQKELNKQAIIIDEKIEIEKLDDGNAKLKVLFIVEQDIVSF